MLDHVTIVAGKMIENQRVIRDLSRAVDYCHYYHKEKKIAKTKQKKGRKKKRRPLLRVRVLLTPVENAVAILLKTVLNTLKIDFTSGRSQNLNHFVG